MPGVCDVPGISSACEQVGDAVGGFVEDSSIRVLSAIARGVTAFAAMLLELLWGLIQTVTRPQTDAEFLYQWAGMLFGIALPITVAFMCFQVVQSLLRARGWTRSGVMSAVTGAAAAIVGTSASLPIVHYLTLAVDGTADAMTGVILGDVDTLGDAFADAIGGDGVSVWEALIPGGPGQQQLAAESVVGVLGGLIGMIVLGFLMIVGGIAVFAALLIRTLLLYVVVVTGPIAFLGLVWSPVRPWFRRWVTAVVALIFTKLGVVVVFGLGISALNTLTFDGGVGEAIGRLLSGVVLMLIAAVVPIVAFKFFDFLGEETVTALHAGAHGSVARTREAVGRIDPRRVADRMSSNGRGGATPSSSSGNGHTPAPQPAQAGRHTSRPAWASNGARQGPSDPWKDDATSNGGTPGNGWSRPTRRGTEPWSSGTKAGTGQHGTGWSRPGPAAGTASSSGRGAAAGGAAAGAAGAVIGAGAAAGEKTADVGSRAGAAANQQQPDPPDPYVYNPRREPPPDGDPPANR
ncbi:MAG: type IV secretion system protein [bacterium]